MIYLPAEEEILDRMRRRHDEEMATAMKTLADTPAHDGFDLTPTSTDIMKRAALDLVSEGLASAGRPPSIVVLEGEAYAVKAIDENLAVLERLRDRQHRTWPPESIRSLLGDDKETRS